LPVFVSDIPQGAARSERKNIDPRKRRVSRISPSTSKVVS